MSLEQFPSPTPTPPQPVKIEDWLTRTQAAMVVLDWEKIAYVTIAIVAVVSRFWGLGDRVVSHDESLHTQYSYQYFNGDGYIHTPLMHGPFLFHVTALSYWLFGHNDFTARIPVAIFGIILVIFPYFMRDWIGRRGALAASVILLISPYVTYYSRYIRHDVFVIVWALIIVVATWHYQRDKKEQSLWWFAAGLALLFATKEVSFIYVAIFGSFLVLRLLLQIIQEKGIIRDLKKEMIPLLLLALSITLLAGGFLVERLSEADPAALTTGAEPVAPQAADPTQQLEIEDAAAGSERFFGIIQIVGLVGLGGGLFLLGRQLRPRLERYPEFDLIVLYVTLLLPLLAALFVSLAGGNPRDFTMNLCVLAGQESMGTVQLFLSRLISFDCWGIFFSDGLGFVLLFLIPLLAVGVLIGLWWHRRKWVTVAAIFHILFLLLFTSLFTNPGGWYTGTVESLGYWLEQQAVQRGSQPTFYYALVAPLYEFLPLIFSFLAVTLWASRYKLLPLVNYWLGVIIVSWLGFGLANWFYNSFFQLFGADQVTWPGWVTVGVIIGVLGAVWILWLSVTFKRWLGIRRWGAGMGVKPWIDVLPFFVWWLLLSVAAYTIAGEKMPWLSIHFVIPMAFIVGWYVNERLRGFTRDQLLSWPVWAMAGLFTVLAVALFLAFGPLFLGQIQFGGLEAAGQYSVGRFMGSVLAAGGIAYLVNKVAHKATDQIVRLAALAAVFGLLALLTVRFNYMANFPNADYTTEFLVYAHGAPATKTDVMPQLERLSMRIYGDRSLRVFYDNETSWPFTWYLRTFPQRVYFGATPNPDIRNADAVLVGDVNYLKVEPFLSSDFDYQEFTYLWWPMEDYRRISWATIIGNPWAETIEGQEPWRGVFDRDVRAALWDIFFYRDYDRWAQVTGRSYNVGSWPLRRTMRLYISRDAKQQLWDRGLGAATFVAPVDPYAEGELGFNPDFVIGEGVLRQPRNLAIAADGTIFVADSGNHRVAVFDESGNFVRAFGEFGAEPGFFNEPWGIAVDDIHIYVADTWNHRVQKFTKEGEFVAVIGATGTVDSGTTAEGLFFGPRDVLLLSDNRMLVTDTGNHRLQLFDRDGNFIATVGSIGAQPGEFYEPVGIAEGVDGSIYVADTWNERVQQLLGEVPLLSVNSWSVDAWNTSQSIENKPYVTTDESGRLFMTDPENYRVLIFDSQGEYLGRLGNYSTGYDGFGLPNGIKVDGRGRLYVVDSANGRIMRFDVAALELGP